MSKEESIEDVRERKLEELRERAGEANEDARDGDGAGTPSEPVHVAGADDLSEIVESHGVVLADFYADWCGPCQMLEPVVETIAAETPAAVAKVDVDEHQSLAGEYGVRGVPTLVLFADGEPVERLVGMQEEATLRDLVAEYA